MNLYFITRSFPNVGTSSGGGALARQAQVDVLKDCGYNVKVVVPNPNGSTYEENDIIHIGFKRYKKLYSGLEKLGLTGDAYYPWVKAMVRYLKERITEKDIIMSVTGGSADTFMAGYALKKSVGCKLVLSYHDPINYTTFNNLVVDNHYFFKKDALEKKIINFSDLIFTSSDTFRQALAIKYPAVKNKIHNYYFGYNQKETIGEKKYRFPLTLAYAGSFNKHQSPEIMHRIGENLKDYQLCYLGNYNNYAPLQSLINDKEFKGSLGHQAFLEFAKKNIDIGFVCLTSEYLSACFPSKIFEYINLGLPILGALPDSDARHFINDNGIGKAFHYSDIEGMRSYLMHLKPVDLEKQRDNIIRLKEKLHFTESLKGMCSQIKNLI